MYQCKSIEIFKTCAKSFFSEHNEDINMQKLSKSLVFTENEEDRVAVL